MKRLVREVIMPSIFTSRNNANHQKKDRYEHVAISSAEVARFGGSKDKDGQYWLLNRIVADESGEVLRERHIQLN